VERKGTFNMIGGEISGNTAIGWNGGGVRVQDDSKFNKTGGTITGYGNNTANGNKVLYENNNIKDNYGHAVAVGPDVDGSVLYHRETTAGPGINLSYDGLDDPPTISENWDKVPNSSIEIILPDMSEWDLLGEQPVFSTGRTYVFGLSGSYNTYQWYLNGNKVGTGVNYFFIQEPGVYEVAVVVEDNAGEKRSGSCQVIVR